MLSQRTVVFITGVPLEGFWRFSEDLSEEGFPLGPVARHRVAA